MTAHPTADIKTDPGIGWRRVPPTTWSRLDVEETNGEPERPGVPPEPVVFVEMLGGTATADWVFAGADPVLSGTRHVHGPSEPKSPRQTICIDIRNRKWLELKWRHFSRAGREERVARALAALERAVIPYRLDAETVRWLAEDADLEDL
jgi:hypothetical protein